MAKKTSRSDLIYSKVKSYLKPSLLHIACGVGNASFAKALVRRHNANLSSLDDNMQNTPLHVVALAGQVEVVSILL